MRPNLSEFSSRLGEPDSFLTFGSIIQLQVENYRTKIEAYGSLMESMGLTPVAARIYVYLLFSQREQATFEAMVHYFQVSKSAVSNALKLLTAVNMVEAKTKGGQRKRYFTVNFEKMFNHQELTERFQMYSSMLDDIRQHRGQQDALSQELADVASLYKMMIIELPIILERWRRMRGL